MPGFNRTGPMGTGPMTGGRRGLCGDVYNRFSCLGGRGGRRAGLGRGYGRGRFSFGNEERAEYPRAFGSAYSANKEDELSILRAEANTIRTTLESVQNRIAELEKETSQ